MKVYIAGKVTGIERQVVENNFARAEKFLKTKGYEVVNPLKIVDPDLSWQDAMDVCLAELETCDAIYMLGDWQDSLGAKMEAELAEKNGLLFLNK
ncbi:MAG: DUF4406 domain-containing protein [Bacteroidales bacterium]|jgi:hypothetical protein